METRSFTAMARTQTRETFYAVELCKTTLWHSVHYQNIEKYRALCKFGCKNYNRKWCCPPHAPSFSSYIQPWHNLCVVFLHVEMIYFADIKNPYLRVKAANSMLKSRADKFVRKLSETGGRAISSGSCRLCKPCHYQKNEKCAHPDIMAYSYEAMGVNVDALVQDCFGKPLLWYRNRVVPEYTSVVCGFLTNDAVSLEKLHDVYLSVIDDAGTI